MPAVAWNNYAHSMLERTLDDSANRRSVLPEAFLIADEILTAFTRVLRGLQVRRMSIERNLKRFAPFAAMEPLLMALVKQGADRQEMHEVLRGISMQAWETLQQDETNPLPDLVKAEKRITYLLNPQELENLFRVEGYTGIAAQRAPVIAARLREAVNNRV